MPELPEVEVVRRGLARWVAGRVIDAVDVLDTRSIRRHGLGVEDFNGNLVGATVLDVVRRGKFLWMPLSMEPGAADSRVALVAHLGMSGQLLMESPELPDEKHLKVRFSLSARGDEPTQLRFVDQRIFGGLFVTDLVPTADGLPGGQASVAEPVEPQPVEIQPGEIRSVDFPQSRVGLLPLIPVEAAHIARDPLDPDFSIDLLHRRLRARKTGLKRALLDQGMVSGIGNIYADEALWDARLHFARPTDTLRRSETERVLASARQVMLRALEAGGTSFDSLYVNVNGASGYFARSLNAYGREGQPCPRCCTRGLATRIRRDSFMNRSSFSCPVCQPKPRNARW